MLSLAILLAPAGLAQDSEMGRQANATRQVLGSGAAEKRLGQGIAYFYDGRYAQSFKMLREALALKLARPEDEALAHQFSAFFYCLHDALDSCEDEFRLALSGPTPIELSASERENPAWRDVYARLRAQMPGGGLPNVPRGRFGGRIERVNDPAADATSATQVVSWQQARDRTAAQLRLAIEPWGDVYVNQQKVATSPPIKELRLEPGVYSIEVRNAELPAFVQTVTLKTRETYRLLYQFDTRQ